MMSTDPYREVQFLSNICWNHHVCTCGYAVITVQIDRRKNLGDLKQVLEDIVQVPAADFKVRL